MAEVNIRGVGKRFDSTVVMQDIDLDVADGEFVVLVGASGCGKTTLLRMIAGLEPITSGEIAIGGRRVNELEPRERDIAMVFQSYALYPHLDVRDNMAFSMRLRRRPRQERIDQVAQTAGVLNLAQLLDRYPRQLSGGQRQRVAMGRAIVRHPQVFLFDEPLSNLDAKLRVQMRTEIRALHQRLRATSIYVTHDQVEAMTMADRMVVMNAGRIEQVGAPLHVYDRPASLYVAQFIGSPAINALRGDVVVEGGRAMVRAGDMTLRLPSDAQSRPGTAMVAFRPEALIPAQDGAVRGTATVIETLGPETYVYFDVAGQLLCARVGRDYAPRPGSPVGFDVVPDAIRLFDAQTGASLHG